MPTIKDVAHLAGVTPTTVSRVLNNRGYISETTRKKVYSAMEELKYKPNELARSLYKKKSNIIGLIVPTLEHPFFAAMASYIEDSAYEESYKILICNSNHDKVKEKEYVELLKSNQVDGIIMGSHTLDVAEFDGLDYPIVTFDRRIGQFPYICSDNYQGGVLAAESLIKRGCKKVAHFSGSLSLEMLSNLRSEAFIQTLNSYGLNPIIAQTDINVFDDSQYEQLAKELLSNHPDIDGVFCGSDLMAAYVLKHCNSLNMDVPRDIQIIGYDDVSLTSLLNPELTTIHQPLKDMAKKAIQLVIKQINGEEVEQANIFPITLVERRTTRDI